MVRKKMTDGRNYDVRIEYDNGSESICVDCQPDAAAAVVKAVTIVRRKQRILGNYRTVKTVHVCLASNEAYRGHLGQ